MSIREPQGQPIYRESQPTVRTSGWRTRLSGAALASANYFLPPSVSDPISRRLMLKPVRDKVVVPPHSSQPFVRLKPGAELERIIDFCVMRDITLLVEGPPGVGKTYAILKVLQQLRAADQIRGFVYVSANKTMTPDQIFQPDLIVAADDTGKAQLTIRPAEWERLLGDSFTSLINPVPEELDRLNEPHNRVIFVLDETARAGSAVLDATLAMLEGRIFTNAQGNKVIAGIQFISASNFVGMDGTTTAYSPAWLSRQQLVITLSNPDLETFIDYTTISLDARCK